jgi:cathepsin B
MSRFIVVACLLAVAVAQQAITPEFLAQVQAVATFKAGVNEKFTNMTIEQVKKYMGVLPDSADKWAELPLEEYPLQFAPPPAAFDSRTNWPNCTSIGEVRDQAACGSCWAFGAVEAMTDRFCIASKGAQKPHISAEDMNSCCTSCGFGCEGGYPSAAWQFWVSQGVVTGGNYKGGDCLPYSIPNCDHHTTGKYGPCGDIVPTPTCTKQCKDSQTWSQAKKFGARSYGVSGVQNIMTEIQNNGPVEAAFSVYQDFLTYKSGVYQHSTGQMLGGHAVKILGWGTEGGRDYWLVANSWNEDWGDQGFFKILKGSNHCGIEGQIVAGAPKL